MKAIFYILLFCVSLTTSCTNYEEDFELPARKAAQYSPEIQKTIDIFYDFCIEIYSEQIPQSIINDKIETIRFCDLLDYSGDVLLEMDGYELIEDILWPNGYGNPLT